jgi:hypothetical protein
MPCFFVFRLLQLQQLVLPVARRRRAAAKRRRNQKRPPQEKKERLLRIRSFRHALVRFKLAMTFYLLVAT